MKFDIKLLLRYYIRRNAAYGILGLIDAAILRSNDFSEATVHLDAAREAIRKVIAECDKPFEGRVGAKRTDLCRFLSEKLGSNAANEVMEYINEIANDPEPSSS